MGLTRKELKELGLEESQIEAIISKHTETVNEIKDERDKLKGRLGEAEALQKQAEEAKAALDSAKAEAENARKEAQAAKDAQAEAEKKLAGLPDYDGLKAEYEGFKSQVEAERVNAKKEQAMIALLKQKGANEKAIPLLLKGVDLAAVELDGDAVKNADAVAGPVVTQYKDFFGSEQTQGVPPVSPPSGGGGKSFADMTDAEYFALKHKEKKA